MTDYVSAFVATRDREPRDKTVHDTLRELHKALAPDLQDRIAIESYYDPAGDGWRLVMHRIPFRPAAPVDPKEEHARRVLALEEALNDPEGLAIAKAIIERKELHEALVDFQPGGTVSE
jgi:hypothetical protein